MSTGTVLDSVSNDGSFKRKPTIFRSWISSESGSRFPPEKNRYHLYVSLACPWACRVLFVRKLKGLEEAINVSVVYPIFKNVDDPNHPESVGWVFADHRLADEKFEGATNDQINGCKTLRELYLLADPNFKERYTVPVLWDTVNKTIVSNESSEIMVMLNNEFNAFAKHPEVDFYPTELRSEIDRLNDWMYESINNGVYKCGFATKQQAYETAFHQLFERLDQVEEILSKSRYICSSSKLTASDIRLFVTIVRFDAVYVQHFKTNKKRIVDYKNIQNWLKDIYHTPGVKETVSIPHIKHHYTRSHKTINPLGIVPLGPELEFLNDSNHGRENL